MNDNDRLILTNIYNSDLINAPKGDFIYNSRNRKIHIQTFLPLNISCFIIALHGYASHICRPTHTYLSSFLNTLNIGYVTFDFTGHGYSDGQKCYVEDIDILIDDVLSVLIYLFTTLSNKVNKPFYILGHSMGGGMAILIADLITRGNLATIKNNLYYQNQDIFKDIKTYFKGMVLISPVINLIAPSWTYPIINIFSYLFPKGTLPKFIINDSDLLIQVWRCPKYRQYLKHDQYPRNSNGLTYGGNIMFGTVNTITQISKLVVCTIEHITYPFLVMYDEYRDIVIPKSSINLLMTTSKTQNKTYVHIPNGLHDPMANRITLVSEEIYNWIQKQI